VTKQEIFGNCRTIEKLRLGGENHMYIFYTKRISTFTQNPAFLGAYNMCTRHCVWGSSLIRIYKLLKT
jgi:hypothetical protein